MYIKILNQIKNADLHSARSNAIEIKDEYLVASIERLMNCDVEEYEIKFQVLIAKLCISIYNQTLDLAILPLTDEKK